MVAFILVLAFFLGALFLRSSNIMDITNSAQADECREICDFLGQRFNLTEEHQLSWSPGHRVSYFSIFSAHEERNQDRIIDALEEESEKQGWNPIELRFADRGIRTLRVETIGSSELSGTVVIPVFIMVSVSYTHLTLPTISDV